MFFFEEHLNDEPILRSVAREVALRRQSAGTASPPFGGALFGVWVWLRPDLNVRQGLTQPGTVTLNWSLSGDRGYDPNVVAAPPALFPGPPFGVTLEARWSARRTVA